MKQPSETCRPAITQNLIYSLSTQCHCLINLVKYVVYIARRPHLVLTLPLCHTLSTTVSPLFPVSGVQGLVPGNLCRQAHSFFSLSLLHWPLDSGEEMQAAAQPRCQGFVPPCLNGDTSQGYTLSPVFGSGKKMNLKLQIN